MIEPPPLGFCFCSKEAIVQLNGEPFCGAHLTDAMSDALRPIRHLMVTDSEARAASDQSPDVKDS